MAATSTTSGTVTMRREGQLCTVDAGCEKVLRPILRTRVRRCQQILDGSLAIERRTQVLYEHDTIGYTPVLRFWSGLAGPVLTALRQADIRVELAGGLHHAELQVPAPNKTLPDLAVLEHIARHDRGLIRYDAHSVNLVYLIAQIARAWPELKIAVITSGRHDTVNIAAQLRKRGVDAFGYTAQHEYCVEARVSVCTFAGLAFTPVGPEKQDIVIVLDATHAIGEQPRWCLGHTIRARMYGFLSIERSLSPYAEDLVRCIFGFDEVVVPQHGYRMRPIEVAWTRPNRRPRREPSCEAGSDFTIKPTTLGCS
jgi:hypothetical protein